MISYLESRQKCGGKSSGRNFINIEFTIFFCFIGTQMNIEQRMVEQRQRKAADAKKRTQGRQAFKAQLESNAPARKYEFFVCS